jgi:hypothetical protein
VKCFAENLAQQSHKVKKAKKRTYHCNTRRQILCFVGVYDIRFVEAGSDAS